MNNISCLFLSDDLFIIHICCSNIDDRALIDTIKMCIELNAKIESNDFLLSNNMTTFYKYKGIVILKNTEDFNDIKYIIVDVFKSKSIEKMMPELNILDVNPHRDSDAHINHFLAFLIETVKKVIFEYNIDYYNAIHIGEDNTYKYTKDNNTKIDFDILINSLKKIQHTEEADYIYFHLNTRDA
jgi:hypothetical protein